MISGSANPSTPPTNVVRRHEHEQTLGTLPINETDSSSVDTTRAVIGTYSFPQSRDPSGTSLENLERSYRNAQEAPRTSLEVLQRAQHGSHFSDVSIRNEVNESHNLSSGCSIEKPSRIPLPSTSVSTSSTHPSLISLPPSSFEPSSLGQNERLSSPFDESYKYMENNLGLSQLYPHLRCVCSRSRHNRASITIFDYVGSALRDSKHLWLDFMPENGSQARESTFPKLAECRQFLRSVDASSVVETRLVVVEDLGPSLINLLGATFDLSPEFFEEHLHRSQYSGFGVHEPSPQTWRTSNLQKNYVSFAWSRPGDSWTLDIRPDKWEDLLRHDASYVATVTQSKNKQGIPVNTIHNFWTKTNILRKPSDISTDPAGRLPDKFLCGWEERATMCETRMYGLRYGAIKRY